MNTFPVDHLSYSAIRSMANPYKFIKNYINGEWDIQYSIAAAAGVAFHEAMEYYYAGTPLEKAIDKGMDRIQAFKEDEINWGKTGSLEKLINTYNTAVDNFTTYCPDLGEPMHTEYQNTVDFYMLDGKASPVPLKGVIDLVTKINGDIWLVDWKSVRSFSNNDDFIPLPKDPHETIKTMMEQNISLKELRAMEKFNDDVQVRNAAIYVARNLQAGAYYHIAKQGLGVEPKGMMYIEVKTSKVKANEEPIQSTEIIYERDPQCLQIFENLYKRTIKNLTIIDQLSPIPDLMDMMDGEKQAKDFLDMGMEYDLNTEVIPMAKSVTFSNVSKKDYLKSQLLDKASQDWSIEEKIIVKLKEFGVRLEFAGKQEGASVTRYEFIPERGLAISSILKHDDDVALAIESQKVRMYPIYGTNRIGIEVPNAQQKIVNFNNKLLRKGTLTIPVGETIEGNPYTIDLTKAPHLLVAGATGTGKSVFLNTAIESLTQQLSASELELILIDPKMTEFFLYEDTAKVLTETCEIGDELERIGKEMDKRYTKLRKSKCRSIEAYNKNHNKKMPYKIIVIDEIGDLVLSKEKRQRDVVVGREVIAGIVGEEKTKVITEYYGNIIENALVRLAQKARACGIHLILATQRPSTDILSGILKGNLPTRIGFRTATRIDSQVILDSPGCETLLGNGDLLLMTPKEQELIRLQGYFISD